ncbi:hypothetical protein BC830DRAFT_717404 [Chytriomyces sp. MP71]|nr:hypothetical protein BC830DRAFT_717404 [Chytriomyces sp. MP71]
MGGPYGGSSVTKKICGFRAGACNKAGHASTWEEEVRERDGAAHKEVCGETETGSERHFSVRWRWISQLFFCSRTRSITSFCTHSATQPRKQGHPRVRSRPALRRATNVTRDVSGRKRIGLVFFARWCWLTWQREGARRGTAAALHCVFLSIFCTGHNFRFSLVQAWKRWTALEGDQRRDARRRVREGVLEGVWEGVWEGAAEGVAAAVRAAAARGRATVKPSTRGGALAALTDRNKPISITMLSVQAEATKVLWLEPVFRLPKRKTRVHLLGAAAQARPKA